MKKIKRTTLRAEQYKKKKQKKLILIFLGLLILIIAFIVIIFIINRKEKSYVSFEITKKAEWSVTTNIKYLPYRSGVLKFNRDGAEAIAQNGEVLWNVTYSMKDPIADVNGSYVAVADRGGKDLCIINGSGTANRIQVLNNISDVEVALQGVTAVLMNGGTKDYIELYSMDSTSSSSPIAEGQTIVSTDGFPLDITLSPSGKLLVTSYMRLREDILKNVITFYNFGEVGINLADNIVGAYDQEDEVLAPKIEFVSDDVVLVCRNNGFTLYTAKELAKVKAIVDISEEILQLAHSDTYICVIVKNNSGNDRYQIRLYNFNGKLLLSKTTNEEFDRVMVSGEDIVLYSRLTCQIITSDGEEKFRGTFEKNVEYIYPVNNEDKYLLIGDGFMEQMRLKKEQN